MTRRPSSSALDSQSTPARAARPPLPTSIAQTSPAYSTSLRSRHSLYGTEDRVVLDLGSRIWKVGFSGEPNPRECKAVLAMLGQEEGGGNGAVGLWGLEKGDAGDTEWEIREQRLKRGLRDVWFNHLMSDPKARKVIVVENPLLSTRVKAMIARVLFENLQVPSLSFASSSLLSLMATGTVTGLVIDCGNLETSVLSIYSSRPLFPLLLSTPLAGSRVTSRLRSLLLQFGYYVPPPPSLNTIAAPTLAKIPKDLLTEELLEEIKTRVCFVGNRVEESDSSLDDLLSGKEDEPMDEDAEYDEASDLPLLRRMEKRYARETTAKTLSFKVPALSSPGPASGVGKGWIQIPGWVRERAAEVLFEPGNEDELSVTELILEGLLRLPTDLRKPLASSILITGGTSMLPGFFPRLRISLLATLSTPVLPTPSPSPPPLNPHHHALSTRLALLRSKPRFASLAPLASHIAFTNDPSLTSSFPAIPLNTKSGTAPAFTPALLPWIGGSLAGALKTGGEEILRERWEERLEEERRGDEREEGGEVGEGERGGSFVLPDWTLMRLRVV